MYPSLFVCTFRWTLSVDTLLSEEEASQPRLCRKPTKTVLAILTPYKDITNKLSLSPVFLFEKRVHTGREIKTNPSRRSFGPPPTPTPAVARPSGSIGSTDLPTRVKVSKNGHSQG